jgi:hypothetical protein
MKKRKFIFACLLVSIAFAAIAAKAREVCIAET